MTPEDEIKKIVRDVLEQDGPELARQKRIAADRAAFDDFRRRQREPRPDRESAVAATSAPVAYVDTVLPMETFSFDDPGNTGQSSPPPPPLAFTTVSSRICLSDGTVAVVNLMVAP